MPLHHAPWFFWLGALLLAVAAARPIPAQVLLAEDDVFEVPANEVLIVEAFGVLDNDTLDDEAAGENGATAELVVDAAAGTLALAPDGSFSYSPGPGFDGTDSFVYRAVFEAVSSQATVTLTACSAGPQVFTCWKEGAFLAKAAALGHLIVSEGFEDDATWGQTRSPNTCIAVSSAGVMWRANDFDPTHTAPTLPPPPPPNELSTGSGAAISGLWGIFDLEHGYAVGSEVQCDIDAPPAHCLYHDGFTIEPELGSGPLYGAGGFFQGSHGANVAIVVDGDWQNPIGGGKLSVGIPRFFGVIDAGPLGFTEIQFRETDGKAGQQLIIFGDDFTLLKPPVPPIPALDAPSALIVALLLVLGGMAASPRSRRTLGSAEPR